MALRRVAASSCSCIRTKLGFVGAVSNLLDQNLQLLFPPQPSQSRRQFFLGRHGRLRGWDPCDKPYSVMGKYRRSELKEFVEPAKFAVEQYNKLENAHLQFVRVVKAATQVVCGLNYLITLEAINSGGEKKRYETRVWANAAKKCQLQLTLFEPLNSNQANKRRGGGSTGGCAR